MKKVLLSILFLGALGFASAQVVTDFNAWQDTDQNSVQLHANNAAGKAVVVIFYQTTDATSQQLATDLNQLYFDYGSNTGNVLVFGASVIEQNESQIESFMSAQSLSYPNVYGYNPTNQFQSDYLNNVFSGTTPPFLMIVGPDSTAIYSQVGAQASVSGASTALQNAGFNPTGISATLKEKGNFTVFPNPAKDRATIKFMAENGDEVSLDIFNVLGERIESKTNFNSGLNILEVKTTEYANGVYFAKLKTGDNVKTVKFEVAR